jgi:hypothetical protein
VFTRKASTYFLATPLGTRRSTPVSKAGKKPDPSKVDPLNTINISYEELPEEQRQKFKAELKRHNDEMKARLLLCYGKTQQGVVEKEKVVMLPIPSTTTPSSPVINASYPPQDFYAKLISDIGEKIDKGKFINTAYSTKDLALNSAAPTTTTGVELNYFAG